MALIDDINDALQGTGSINDQLRAFFQLLGLGEPGDALIVDPDGNLIMDPPSGPSPSGDPSLGYFTVGYVEDAVVVRGFQDVTSYVTWLAGARGYIGEFGWPANATPTSTIGLDMPRWRMAAAAFLDRLDAQRLPVMLWDVIERSTNPLLNAYLPEYPLPTHGGVITRPNWQGLLLESHIGFGNPYKGVNYAMGSYSHSSAIVGATAPFSNTRDPLTFQLLGAGIYASNSAFYNYGSPETYEYLATRSLEHIRLPFRHERMQRNLGGALDATEIARYDAAIAAIGANGMQAILCPANFGAYWLDDGSQGVKRIIGSAEYTQAHFVDLWTRLSTRYKNDPNVFGYDLMSEPANITAANWQTYSQAAVTAIRATGDTKPILVSGGNFGRLRDFVTLHPGGPWIVDPAANIFYTGHFYFEDSGGYVNSYIKQQDLAEQAGTSSFPNFTTIQSVKMLFSAFSLPNNVQTAIPFDTESLDEINGWTSGANNWKVFVPPGVYLASGRINFPQAATGTRSAIIELRDAALALVANISRAAVVTNGATSPTNVPADMEVFVVTGAGQFVTLQAFQDSGSTLVNVSGSLSIIRLGPVPG